MDIAGNRLRRRFHQRRSDLFLRDTRYFSTDLISSIYSELCKGCDLLCKHRKRALAVFFLVLEAISFLLDVIGKSQWSILLAAFLLSAFGFVMTIFTCILKRTRIQAEKQLGVVEVLFSVVQLIATLLAVLGIKIINNYTASILLLLFAVIAVVFVSRKEENIFDSSSLTNDYETELISTIVHNFPQTPHYSPVNQQLDYDNKLRFMEDGKVSDSCLDQQLNDHTQFVSETGVLVEELNRMSSENKKLTEMITVLCENYNILRVQYKDLMSKSNTENELTISKNRKPMGEKCSKMIGFKGHTEPRSSDEESCKTPEENIKTKVSRVYIRTGPSDTSLIVKDGYQWRKYRQKVTRDNPSPRAFFKCSFAPSCSVKKKVQRSAEDPSILVATYEGEHNHPNFVAAI